MGDIYGNAKCEECKRWFETKVHVPSFLGFWLSDELPKKVSKPCPFCGHLNHYTAREKVRI